MSLRTRSLSPQAVKVVKALARDPAAWRYGYELGVEVGLKSGSLYPILMRLHDRQVVESSWESDAPQGRPPRHLYRLTQNGLALARTLDKSAKKAKAVPIHAAGANLAPR